MILGWGWKRHVFFCLNDFRSGPLPTLRKILWDGERRWPDQRVPWSKLRGHVGTVGWIRPVSPWKSMDIHGSIPSRWGFSSCACADRSVPWCREEGASSGIFLINVRASLDIFRSSQESGYVHFLENHKGWGGLFVRTPCNLSHSPDLFRSFGDLLRPHGVSNRVQEPAVGFSWIPMIYACGTMSSRNYLFQLENPKAPRNGKR